MSKHAISIGPKYDRLGKITYMVRSGGYVMVRRPRCAPFIMSEKDWGKLPEDAEAGQLLTVLHGQIHKTEAVLTI